MVNGGGGGGGGEAEGWGCDHDVKPVSLLGV